MENLEGSNPAAVRPIVLCVDDDDDTLEMLRVLLEDRGYDFRSAATCSEALSFIKHSEANVVLMDNLLPDGSGIDLCRKVREFNSDVPIVIFSGAQLEADQALAAGADAFVSKPCPLDELFGALSRYLPQTRS
ncbi:MAG TPA: response regulator [Blastocatellia bacterium]|nr:response regulator [Blastocatellia bacterium]